MSAGFWIGVVIATVAAMVIGAIWYGVFGNYWMGLVGKRREDLNPSPSIYLIAALAWFTTAIVMSVLIGHLVWESTPGGLVLGILLAVGIVATTMAVNYTFEGRPSRLYALNLGYHLVALVVMGGVIGVIHQLMPG